MKQDEEIEDNGATRAYYENPIMRSESGSAWCMYSSWWIRQGAEERVCNGVCSLASKRGFPTFGSGTKILDEGWGSRRAAKPFNNHRRECDEEEDGIR